MPGTCKAMDRHDVAATFVATRQRTRFGSRCCPSGVLFRVLLIVFASHSVATSPLLAGIGPENTMVVVNARSWSSRTIANHYIQLRKIPTINIVYLQWKESDVQTDIATFRNELLKPVLETAHRRQIGDHIDCIVWSSGFPYEIDFSSEGSKQQRYLSGSITGLTYLYQFVMSEKSDLLSMNHTNRYASTGTDAGSSRGFRNHYSWTSGGEDTTDLGQRYLLSTMLGYTHGRGNSVKEIVQYLKRSAAADGTHPDGTVYFMTNNDVRTKTRSPYFKSVAEAIRREGGKAAILEGSVPVGKQDVIGAMTGGAGVRWDAGSRMLPGAICENLTSFGGVLRHGGGQRPLTDFLQHGAAGSSGTVIEPYAIIDKFPHPIIHLHYRRGCTLAESFYASLGAPYQLLVVGDPLCCPYADLPVVTLSGLEKPASDDIAEVAGEIQLKPSVASGSAQSIKSFDLYVDGRRQQTVSPSQEFLFDSTRLPDGFHELRVVANVNNPMETRGDLIAPIRIANRDRRITAKLRSSRKTPIDGKVSLEVTTPDVQQIMAFQNQNLVAQMAPRDNPIDQTISFTPKTLGFGPVRIILAGISKQRIDNVFARPIDLELTPGKVFPARPSAVSERLEDGLLLVNSDGKKTVVMDTGRPDWLEKSGIPPNQQIHLYGSISIPQTEVYYLTVASPAKTDVTLDGIPLIVSRKTPHAPFYELPLHLAKGWHRLVISQRTTEQRQLAISFGKDGTAPLSGPQFKHAP